VRLIADSVAVGTRARLWPESDMTCGLSGASSVSTMLAVRVPEAVGVKVVVIVQSALGASVVPQSLDDEKSPILVPASAILAMWSVARPVLVMVTAEEGLVAPTFSLGKVSAVADKVSAAAAVPVPLTLAVCGLAGASSATLNEAVREPTAPGVNVTCTAHEAPDAIDEPQLSISPKSTTFVPVKVMPERVTS